MTKRTLFVVAPLLDNNNFRRARGAMHGIEARMNCFFCFLLRLTIQYFFCFLCVNVRAVVMSLNDDVDRASAKDALLSGTEGDVDGLDDDGVQMMRLERQNASALSRAAQDRLRHIARRRLPFFFFFFFRFRRAIKLFFGICDAVLSCFLQIDSHAAASLRLNARLFAVARARLLRAIVSSMAFQRSH